MVTRILIFFQLLMMSNLVFQINYFPLQISKPSKVDLILFASARMVHNNHWPVRPFKSTANTVRRDRGIRFYSRAAVTVATLSSELVPPPDYRKRVFVVDMKTFFFAKGGLLTAFSISSAKPFKRSWCSVLFTVGKSPHPSSGVTVRQVSIISTSQLEFEC